MIEPAVAGVIGWPVAHSKSPIIHRFWLEKLGIDGDYSRFPVAPERLADFVRAMPAMGLRGVNVTIPHKVAVLDLVDDIVWPSAPGFEITDDMRSFGVLMPMIEIVSVPRPLVVGAVNTIVNDDGRLVAHNTDVEGFRQPLFKALADLPKDRVDTWVTLIGTGGAARAVAAALCGWEVTVFARDVAKAVELVDSFGLGGGSAMGNACSLAELADTAWYREIAGSEFCNRSNQRYNQVIVNASSLGMAGQPTLEIDLSPFPDDTIVYDLVYSPLETPLLAAARQRGMRIIDGLEMLIGQAAIAFELFFGAAAPRQHDDELRALLTR